MSVVTSIMLLAAGPAGGGNFDPFALAMPDWFLCQTPTEADMKCDALMEIKSTAAQRYVADVRQSAPQFNVQIRYDDEFEMLDGKTCTPMNVEMFRNLRFIKDGRERSAGQAPAEMAQLRKFFAWTGKNIKACTSFTSDGGAISTLTEISGEPKPGYYVVLRAIEGTARWVHKDDGWTLRN